MCSEHCKWNSFNTDRDMQTLLFSHLLVTSRNVHIVTMTVIQECMEWHAEVKKRKTSYIDWMDFGVRVWWCMKCLGSCRSEFLQLCLYRNPLLCMLRYQLDIVVSIGMVLKLQACKCYILKPNFRVWHVQVDYDSCSHIAAHVELEIVHWVWVVNLPIERPLKF